MISSLLLNVNFILILFREPDEVYLNSLKPCHAIKVHAMWGHKHIISANWLEELVDHFPSVGVYLKSNKLVTWAICNPPGGGISHLYTEKDHRNKGYATLAVRFLSKQLANNGLVPYATIGVDNEASAKLFSAVGFQRSHNVHFLIS